MNPKILFLCTGNSCRSQMAEGWLRLLHNDSYEAYSAGIDPHGLNPLAIKAMAEIDVDISTQTSDHIDDYLNSGIDYIFTVCDNARESCPYFPGEAKIIHQGFEDPPALAKDVVDEDEALRHYRRVRDEIRDFVVDIAKHLDS